MREDQTIVVTGVGFCTALGMEPASAMARGESGVLEQEELYRLPHREVARVGKIDLRPWLKRRKDRKLMARPAQLALAAAGPALSGWSGATDDLGLYLGVGREPGDDGESEPALVAAQIDGKLDEDSVAGRCRDLYPPLLPLKTLPNMALAHISIHLDVRGENGAWSGGSAAGITALRAGIWSIREGRCPAALVVASDSWVSIGAVRDLLRISDSQPIRSPGEAGVSLLIESLGSARARGAEILAVVDTDRAEASPLLADGHFDSLGRCHAADALLAVALRVGRDPINAWIEDSEAEQPSVGVRVEVSSSDAWYSPASEDGSNG